jgi:hypothetical protein
VSAVAQKRFERSEHVLFAYESETARVADVAVERKSKTPSSRVRRPEEADTWSPE